MKKPISVKTLNQYISRELSVDPILKNIYVIGEVTNLHKNKYMYFDLKEDDDLINCVYFNNELDFINGDKIIVNGSITTYKKASRYQINVKDVQITGQGDSFYQLKLLKEKLFKKGYFDPIYKKGIPEFPVRIGLITSDKSAAIVDFLTILEKNMPIADVYLFPTRVQGQEAKNDILSALSALDNKDLDIIVLTRGGGSNEDLAIFNDEDIADRIFISQTPIISAVGHEIDTSIADLVADLRVSTPTKAAEHIVSAFIESLVSIDKLVLDNEAIIASIIDKKYLELDIIRLEIEKHSPRELLSHNDQFIGRMDAANYEMINKSIFQKFESINCIKSSIEDSMNLIMQENMMKILDLNLSFVDVNNLDVGKEYLMTNDSTKYKIQILEKFNG